MSIRSVLNNLDLILSKKDMIIKRHDIGSIIIKIEKETSAEAEVSFDE